MQRLHASLLLAISLLAGIVIGMAFGRPAGQATPVSAAGESDTAIAFYEALNRALSGGATGDLSALLAPSFQDHDAATGTTRSAEAFIETVRSLGRAPGAVQIEVNGIQASGSSLIVSVHPASPEQQFVAGVAVERTALSPGYDVLRIVRGKVVDRWSAGAWWIDVRADAALEFQVPGAFNLITSLVRMEIPSETVREWTASLPGFVLIETGSAVVFVTPEDGRTEEFDLVAGAAIAIQDRDRIQFVSNATGPVSFLIYTPVPLSSSVPPPPGAMAAQEPQGMTRSLLWRGAFEPAGVRTVHRLGTIELPARGEIQLTVPMGATLLVSIDSGSVDLSGPGSTISILGDSLAPVSHEGAARIDASRAASISTASSVTLRNAADHLVRVAVITIEPELEQAKSYAPNPNLISGSSRTMPPPPRSRLLPRASRRVSSVSQPRGARRSRRAPASPCNARSRARIPACRRALPPGR